MSKKIFLIIVCIFLQISACHAASQLRVMSMEDFRTDSPNETIDVRVIDATELGKYTMPVNTILHSQVLQIIDPKRGKRSASFYVKPLSYTVNDTVYPIEEEMYGKYSKVVLTKEEVKKLPYGKMIKNGALLVGS